MSGTEPHITNAFDDTNPIDSAETWQALVSPGDVFAHPREVLDHPTLTDGQKRAILASWASDANAMVDAPDLRCLSGRKAHPVSLDAVLQALKQLDEEAAPIQAQSIRGGARQERRRPRLSLLRRYVRRNRRDDDDDPPPCPALIMPRPWSPQPAAAVAAA